MKKEKEIINYFDIYKDIWVFHKKYIESVQNGNVDWEMLIEDANKLQKKYQCDFCKQLIFIEMNEFERISEND